MLLKSIPKSKNHQRRIFLGNYYRQRSKSKLNSKTKFKKKGRAESEARYRPRRYSFFFFFFFFFLPFPFHRTGLSGTLRSAFSSFSFVRRSSGVLSPATHTHPLFSFFLSGQHNMKYSTNIHGRPIRPGI
jgi:hypothetical protein